MEERYRIKIFTGVEVLTTDGDIICFGLDRIPDGNISALELVDYLHNIGGASIAAHPYRDNDRGIKDKILDLNNLTAIEAFNGNTSDNDNRKAYDLARNNSLKTTGSSDSHRLEKIGCFATVFENNFDDVNSLISALKTGIYRPVKYDYGEKSFCKSIV